MGLIHYDEWKRLAEKSKEAQAIEVQYKALLKEMDILFDKLKEEKDMKKFNIYGDRYEFVLHELDRLEAEGKALLDR